MHNLTLQVADMSGDGLTATALAIITLEDVNDNAPAFTRDEVPPLPAPPPALLELPFPLRLLVGTRGIVEGGVWASCLSGAETHVRGQQRRVLTNT